MSFSYKFVEQGYTLKVYYTEKSIRISVLSLDSHYYIEYPICSIEYKFICSMIQNLVTDISYNKPDILKRYFFDKIDNKISIRYFGELKIFKSIGEIKDLLAMYENYTENEIVYIHLNEIVDYIYNDILNNNIYNLIQVENILNINRLKANQPPPNGISKPYQVKPYILRNMNKYELTNIISNIDNHITIHLPQINKKHKEIYKNDVFTLLIVCLILYLLTF